MGPDAKKRFRIRVLIDVALGPIVETGAGVSGYSGGVAAEPFKSRARIMIKTTPLGLARWPGVSMDRKRVECQSVVLIGF